MPHWPPLSPAIDGNPGLAGKQAVTFAGAKVQTIIRGQQWKISTKTADGKLGATFFLKYDAADGKLDLLAEGQTFELPAESFSIEIVGSLKIKEDGSSNPNADDAVRLFGGFFLRITPERFEIFVQAEAEIPALGLNGRAVGLLIIDADASSPGLPGIAMLLNLELTLGASPDGPEGGDQPRPWMASSSCAAAWWSCSTPPCASRCSRSRRASSTCCRTTRPPRSRCSPPRPRSTAARRVNAAPEFYVSANIQGSIKLFDTITLTGFISFTAASDIDGNAFVRIAGAVSVNIEFIGALSGSLDLQFYTNLDGQGPGILGRVQLVRSSDGLLLGVIASKASSCSR
jgi:hypothetical protein